MGIKGESDKERRNDMRKGRARKGKGGTGRREEKRNNR